MARDPVNVFELWVVEYSQSEHAFGVVKYGDALERNLHLFLNNQENDRVILAFAFSEELATEMRRAFDCREDRGKPFTLSHIETIKELLQAAAQRFD
ncbi:MAG TPA: hypothetical protein VNT99_05405 [Methylomirabilota bacterium]|nr:hypothetical protein [Methylomirabilota bacterium]